MTATTPPAFRVVIVGGGVAAIEAALALHELGGDRIATTILAPNHQFVYRPMTVREPFAYALARRYSLERLARDVCAELRHDKLTRLDPDRRCVYTESGGQIGYDAVLLALGAVATPRFEHAITIEATRLDEQLHGLIQDVEGGYSHKLGFLIPTGPIWPLPIYELALMTAARASEMGAEVSITIATPEAAPLAIFGEAVSDRVRQLLEEHGILTVTSAHCEVPEPGTITLDPGSRRLFVNRIVALPALSGPAPEGVPRSPAGFIPVDPRSRVRGLDRVYAAGDATDFPIKYGGIAAQQADVATQAIAALAGLAPEPEPLEPVIHGILLTGGKPLYLSAVVQDGQGTGSEITETPSWSPSAKIVARHLAPYLLKLDRAATAE